ncbi:hypothetical protein GHT06_017753 [Daphnia sinensis]|uniref:Uncharacterized protein n=1 Tax=Daphnia sinensis TaxID=1820382 RepID=A0AAD5PRS6_9CRUS|nr:hypothetical protein GHT06_017753 [Daphnia sinensis]
MQALVSQSGPGVSWKQIEQHFCVIESKKMRHLGINAIQDPPSQYQHKQCFKALDMTLERPPVCLDVKPK